MMKQFAPVLAALALSASLPAYAGAASSAAEPTIDPLAKKITGSQSYVSMFGIRASITHRFTSAGFIAVDAGLDVPEARTRKQIAAIRPRIVDALRQSVAVYANGSYRMGEAPNLDLLRSRMQRAVNRQIGEGKATVLLASVIVFEAE